MMPGNRVRAACTSMCAHELDATTQTHDANDRRCERWPC